MITLLRALLFFTLFSSSVYAQTSGPLIDPESAAILDRVKAFYTWVLSNSRSVMPLEPRIKNVKGNARFYLDVSTLNAFSTAFMRSGDFSDDFPSKLEKYYDHYKKEFSGYSQKKFAQIKKDGRGPLMETEDMDIFFCAQEYEYAQPFVDQMKLADIKISGKTAAATVVSPYNWKTEFQLKKIGPRWLISGYCQYK
ncbi:MAG TPA: hypothetical protein VIF82_13700 [Burkholderiaceae bacterium]|jgi:hypothetical protein